MHNDEQRASRANTAVFLLAALPVILLAALARFHDLDAQSLWNDEGNSLRLAQRGVNDLIDAAGRDIHPPGYYLALKTWISAAGDSEFSLRALSAFEGVLTAAAVIALGRALFSRSAGLVAGLIVALSPFAVYYSQETRMYAQLGLLAAVGVWLCVRWVHAQDGDRSGWRWALALALCNAAGLYTQYTYPFSMLAQGVIVVAWLVSRRSRPGTRRHTLAVFVALNVITLALFVPWLPTAWDQVTNWPRTGVDLALDEQLRTVFTWITFGSTAHDLGWGWLIAPGVLAGAALLGSRRRQAAYMAVWAAIVIGALFASGAYREANLKFLLPAQAALSVLTGGGVWGLWTGRTITNRLRAGDRLLAGACLLVLIAGQINALDALYTDPAYARDDYRALAAQITHDPRPGDAIILDAPNQAEVFTYYYHGAAPVYELPRGLGGDDAQTRTDVQAVIAQHTRIFAVLWGEEERDPRRIVQKTLETDAFPVASGWYGDVRLAQYAVLGAPPGAPHTPVNARFGDHITLDGCALSADQTQPGSVLGVTLFWRTDAPLATRYKVTVQLLAPDGTLITQHDGEPGNNLVPTTIWTPGERVIDLHGLVIPPDQTPGEITLAVGLYDIDAPSERLPITASEDLTSTTSDNLLILGTLDAP
ncbi:MAG: glycosyltransferase family 39 protein [Anaerolineae bacterium]|nr:glycosyltransferase family 39 protein [Anaerolineae bacterium]